MPGPGRLYWGEYMDAHHPHTHPTHICTHTQHTHVHSTHIRTHHTRVHTTPCTFYTPHHVHSTHTMHTRIHTTHTPCVPHTHVHTTHIHTQHDTHHTQAAVGAVSSTCPHTVPALCLELLKPGLCFLIFSSHKDLPGRFSMTVC